MPDPKDDDPAPTDRDPGPFAEECQEERIEKLKQRAAELADGDMTFWENDEMPPDVQEEFWEHVVAFESYGEYRFKPIEVLREGGLEFPPADELDDEAVHAKLWELLYAMALQRWYVNCTDHLSDRELYVKLIDALADSTISAPPDANMTIDLISNGDEEGLNYWLKHYTDEKERRHWAEEFPEDEIPDHEDPPYDRDRFLPRPLGPGYPPPEEGPVM